MIQRLVIILKLGYFRVGGAKRRRQASIVSKCQNRVHIKICPDLHCPDLYKPNQHCPELYGPVFNRSRYLTSGFASSKFLRILNFGNPDLYAV